LPSHDLALRPRTTTRPTRPPLSPPQGPLPSRPSYASRPLCRRMTVWKERPVDADKVPLILAYAADPESETVGNMTWMGGAASLAFWFRLRSLHSCLNLLSFHFFRPP
jgi:hypothetical protein